MKKNKNTTHYNRLILFWKTVLPILKNNNITYVIFGSFCLKHYSTKKDIDVNDIDVMIPQQEWNLLIEQLQKNNIDYKQKNNELTLQQQDLKIEIDDWGLGLESLKKNIKTRKITVDNTIMNIITKETMKRIFCIALADQTNTDSAKIRQRIKVYEDITGEHIKKFSYQDHE
ncbi:MAG: hypothetical protein ACQESC_00285 [Nanobdellota archaeon]